MENHKNILEISHSSMKGMDMFRRSEKGYALVELLLVVVIRGGTCLPYCDIPGATYSINEDGRAECSFHGNIQGET